jgi:hypothetical protein
MAADGSDGNKILQRDLKAYTDRCFLHGISVFPLSLHCLSWLYIAYNINLTATNYIYTDNYISKHLDTVFNHKLIPINLFLRRAHHVFH